MTAKEARKARVAKNLKQQEGNIKAAAKRAGPAPVTSAAYAGGRRGAESVPVPVSISEGSGPAEGRNKAGRKAELERRALLSKVSTGSMGKFDKKLEGDVKVKGEKRKVRSTLSRSEYRAHRLTLVSGLSVSLRPMRTSRPSKPTRWTFSRPHSAARRALNGFARRRQPRVSSTSARRSDLRASARRPQVDAGVGEVAAVEEAPGAAAASRE